MVIFASTVLIALDRILNLSLFNYFNKKTLTKLKSLDSKNFKKILSKQESKKSLAALFAAIISGSIGFIVGDLNYKKIYPKINNNKKNLIKPDIQKNIKVDEKTNKKDIIEKDLEVNKIKINDVSNEKTDFNKIKIKDVINEKTDVNKIKINDILKIKINDVINEKTDVNKIKIKDVINEKTE